MTDRELLELAAKAAGWTGWQSKHGYWNLTSPEGETSFLCSEWTDWHRYDPDTGKLREGPTFGDAIAETGWSPLAYDGDALRLAVKLKIIVSYADAGGGPYVMAGQRLGPFSREPLPVKVLALDEELAATRRAIVRAAAEIGKAMP